jgi:hypothetical protein
MIVGAYLKCQVLNHYNPFDSMKKIVFIPALFCPFLCFAQLLSSWTYNLNGKKASYYATSGSGMNVTYTFTNSTDSADVLAMCYDANYVYIKSLGMTDYMGKFLNPGSCIAQNYVHKFPRNPSVPTTKTISPKGGAIGLLTNGIPIFGLGNSQSWNGSTLSNTGSGVWNAEVGKYEGFVLDTAFGAHPQQQGAYHSHTTPYRLYKYYAATVHSPIIGFAFDGNPIYGPYGYSAPLDNTSAIARMKTGYSLRSDLNTGSTRNTVPAYTDNNGTTTTSTTAASRTGPSVNTTYPKGAFCEDYAWYASNGGDLDRYNGRYCVTPEYPSGTYAYFVTVSAAGVAEFPYYIGIQYYGAPETSNFSNSGTGNGLTLPSGLTCVWASNLPFELLNFRAWADGRGNKLVWQTMSEVNVSHFTIEKSRDGEYYSPIGEVRSQGSDKGVATYEFRDEDPSVFSHYRLRMVDLDGKETFSRVEVVQRKGEKGVSVFPSTVRTALTVRAKSRLENGLLTIYDLAGKTIAASRLNLETGAQESFDTSLLPRGLFIVAVENAGLKEVFKIVKE